VKALTQSHEAALQDVRRELKDLRARSQAEIAESMRQVKNLEFKLQLALRFPAATREYYMTPLVPASP
jgi:Skp family chaperone for outer membrane proteins